MYAGDVDGDGDLDLMAASSFHGKIAWYENGSPITISGRALSLDGADDYIDFSKLAGDLTANSTFEAWVKPDMDNQTEGTGILFARNATTGGNVLLIGIENAASPDSKQLRVFDEDSGNWEISSLALTSNQWYHVAYTLSGTTGTLYLNGQEVGTHSLGAALASDDKLSVGQEYDNGLATGNILLAEIDELQFWDTALTQDQIQQNMYQSLRGTEYNLAGYYSLDKVVGFNAIDKTSNKYNSPMHGSPSPSNDTHPYGTYITGNEGWRMLTAPVGGASYGELLDPLWTQGFTGADAPDNGNSNVLIWDETTQALTSISNASDVPSVGSGFLAYVYDDDDYDGAGDGFPKMIQTDSTQRSDSVSPTLSFTDSGTIADDGWNLVGNPYGATINWDAASGLTYSNLDASFYVWSDSANSGAGDYLSWNGSVGTFGGGEIAPWQGFWVKANATSPTLSLTDEARNAGGVFRKEAPVAQLGFTLAGETLSSKTILMFSDKASLEKDVLDAYKLKSLNPDNYLSLFTQLEDGAGLDINALPISLDEPISIPLDFEFASSTDGSSSTPNNMELSWNPENLPDEMTMMLVDNQTGTEINLTDASSYSFEMDRKAKTIKLQHLAIPTFGVFSPNVVKAKATSSRFTVTVLANSTVGTELKADLPNVIELQQNYPNPFNPSTNIAFGLPESGKITLKVFDMLGRKVATLLNNQNKSAGRYSVRFDAGNLASGLYLYRLVAGSTVITKKLTLIK